MALQVPDALDQALILEPECGGLAACNRELPGEHGHDRAQVLEPLVQVRPVARRRRRILSWHVPSRCVRFHPDDARAKEAWHPLGTLSALRDLHKAWAAVGFHGCLCARPRGRSRTQSADTAMSSSTAHIDCGAACARAGKDVLCALRDPGTYGGREPVIVHETHASRVFVCGSRAYKVKKPVAFGFLDYSTLALRRAACEEEVRVNNELAPDIYLGVRAIVPAGEGIRLLEADAPEAIEYAIEMRTFSEADTLEGLIAARALTNEHVIAVARRLARFHDRATPVEGGDSAHVQALWSQNLGELEDVAVSLHTGWDVAGARSFAHAFSAGHAEEIRERAARGLVRDGHGDLRCEHVLVRPRVRVVDRIEFDPGLRRTDIACDLAFLTMDLEARGERAAATRLLDAYRAEGPDPGSDELLAFYAAHRALVRAKVELLNARALRVEDREDHLERAEVFWRLAESLRWRARGPLALVVCGPAASGKSTLADALARSAGLAVVSSDALRRASARVLPGERGAPELYTEPALRAAYEGLAQEARTVLDSSGGVVVDATCRSREQRAPLLRALDRHERAALLVIRCEAPLEVALGRAARRTADPARLSDATETVVREHYRSFESIDEVAPGQVLGVDTTAPVSSQIAAVAAAADRLIARRGAGARSARRARPAAERPRP